MCRFTIAENKGGSMQRNGIIKKCVICGKEFHVSQSKSHIRCCSVQCAAKKKKKITNKTCPQCGNLFEPYNSCQKYCSNRCSWDSKKKGGIRIAPIVARIFGLCPVRRSIASIVLGNVRMSIKNKIIILSANVVGNIFILAISGNSVLRPVPIFI